MIYSLDEYKKHILDNKEDYQIALFIEKISSLNYHKTKLLGEDVQISNYENLVIVRFSKEPSLNLIKILKTFDKDVVYYVKAMNTKLAKVHTFDEILDEAIRLGASDIHIEPQHDSVRVRFRLDGDLKPVYSGGINASTLINIIKVRSGLDPMSKEIQESSYNYRDFTFRISIVPGFTGEKIVIRILAKGVQSLNLIKLGYPKKHIEEFISYVDKDGINLICGQTGSGKNTTMHAILNIIANETKNTISIEDPVEYRNDAITQLEVDTPKGRSFHKLLKSILRQDPDIIYIGEIRDEETVSVALRTAITGHTVLSTLHTKDVESTFERLEDMGARTYLIKEAIRTVTCQKLIKTLCPHCRKKTKIFDKKYGEIETYKSDGCDFCEDGYSGRIGIFESYIFDKHFEEMTLGKTSIKGKKLLAYEESLYYLLQNGKIDYKTYLEYLEG